MTQNELEMTDKIGYQLFKKGIIDVATLEKALEVKNSGGNVLRRNLAHVLVQEFKYDHDTIFREVASLYAFKVLEPKPDEFTPEKIEKIKERVESAGESLKTLMLERKVIPYGMDDKVKDKLIYAAIDPTDRNIPRIAFGMKIQKYEVQFLPKAVYDFLIMKVYPPENEYLKMLEENANEVVIDAEPDKSLDEAELDAEINKSALINLVEASLVEGVRRGVSDIHFVPKSHSRTEIHFRTDGLLRLWHAQDGTSPEALMAVVKDRSRGMDRFEREKAQDGFIQREIDGTIIRFRVSVLPMVGTELKNKFESVVIRILDDRKVVRDLGKLGLMGYARDAFQKAITQPQGMVILTGPTGSGKSTTLVAALFQVIDPTVNVLTVEDPVEYVIEGARQLKIGHKMNFEQAIRSILRHDPDIVLVGEMRDKETAETAIKLANTGHLTFSTLHTNDAPSAVARLFKMGIEPFLIAYAINIIVAQRLIRRLCEHCKVVDNDIDDDMLKAFGLDPQRTKGVTIYKGVGCDKCSNTGYKGRLAIHEALYFTKDIRQLIVRAGDDIDEEKIRIQAKKDGTLNLRDSGFEKVLAGITSIDEVVSATMEE